MTRECRIGCLAWFAGVWWLGLSWAAHTVAKGAARAGWFGLAWAAIGWTQAAARLASACAREGGAE